MKNVFNGFKEFVLRGNAIDLAVGVVIGGAFTLVVTSIVDGLINPLVAAIFGKPDLTGVLNFTLNGADFSIGLILDALFKFLCVAAALYFVIILPMNHLASMRKTGEQAEPEAPAEDVLVLQEIRDLLAAQNARGAGPGSGPVDGPGIR
ncbi:mechanosensitive ion channel protein MscL [Oerskovia sp. Root918]|uniref:large conductance mechanosensitive channel protein MscL n=1 Tax=unclassified Oerskovia TaxID=2619021 RepID=UPI0006F71377|nr:MULTISPECIES: large conductance mechanosensitive channel protein MscL [unclassified Oerskovia]KRC42548.1 mechanosensitive ion channel protein MscL [Oerskovia sp. Root22]KRD47316.1 mechanosensitive ion channel protein MscL [Oerskovia sp. Root918]